MADLDALRDRLVAIGEELSDAAIALLKEAVVSGATKRPEAERRLSQARRSIDKAVALLDRVIDGGAAADDPPDED